MKFKKLLTSKIFILGIIILFVLTVFIVIYLLTNTTTNHQTDNTDMQSTESYYETFVELENPQYFVNESANIVITDSGFDQSLITLELISTNPIALLSVANQTNTDVELEITQIHPDAHPFTISVPAQDSNQFGLAVYGSFIVKNTVTNETLQIDIHKN